MPQHTSPVDTAAKLLAEASLLLASAPTLADLVSARVKIERATWEMERCRGDGPLYRLVRVACVEQREECDSAIVAYELVRVD